MFFLLNFTFFFIPSCVYMHLTCIHSLIRKMCVCMYGKTNIMSNKKLCWKIIIMRWVCAYFFILFLLYILCCVCLFTFWIWTTKFFFSALFLLCNGIKRKENVNLWGTTDLLLEQKRSMAVQQKKIVVSCVFLVN